MTLSVPSINCPVNQSIFHLNLTHSYPQETTMEAPLIQNYPLPHHMLFKLQACASSNLPAPPSPPQTLQLPPKWHLTQLVRIRHRSPGNIENSHHRHRPRTYRFTFVPPGTLLSQGGYIECDPIIEPVLDNPDVEMMRLVHNHSPRSIHYIFDFGETLLSTYADGANIAPSPITSCQNASAHPLPS